MEYVQPGNKTIEYPSGIYYGPHDAERLVFSMVPEWTTWTSCSYSQEFIRTSLQLSY